MYAQLRNGRKGGEIIMYILRKHKFKLNNHVTKYFECIIGQLITPSKRIMYLCAVYRPPSYNANKSTTQLLSDLTNYVNASLDKKKHVLMVFIDYSKAFDILQHNILIEKFENTGIRGPLLRLCENYLTNRASHTEQIIG